jgi:hypothetical protein
MAGLKVENMAACIWPNLSGPNEDRRPTVTDRETRPEWGSSVHPAWSEPPPIVRDYSKVPGLVPVSSKGRKSSW